MFYPLYAISSQISPEPHSSGIQILEGMQVLIFYNRQQ